MLENTMIQLAIGFSPVMLIFVAMSIFSKKHKVANIVSAIFFLCYCWDSCHSRNISI